MPPGQARRLKLLSRIDFRAIVNIPSSAPDMPPNTDTPFPWLVTTPLTYTKQDQPTSGPQGLAHALREGNAINSRRNMAIIKILRNPRPNQQRSGRRPLRAHNYQVFRHMYKCLRMNKYQSLNLGCERNLIMA